MVADRRRKTSTSSWQSPLLVRRDVARRGEECEGRQSACGRRRVEVMGSEMEEYEGARVGVIQCSMHLGRRVNTERAKPTCHLHGA